MPNEPQQTSVSNPEYNLISTIYHSLKSSQTYASYMRDAQAAGDQDLANFFMQMQRQNDQCAQMARQFLSRPAGAGIAH